MSASWTCWLCGGYDNEEPRLPQCLCVALRREDWIALLMLWTFVRMIARRAEHVGTLFEQANDGTIVVDAPTAEQLDTLFYKGEECEAQTSMAMVAGGKDSCT